MPLFYYSHIIHSTLDTVYSQTDRPYWLAYVSRAAVLFAWPHSFAVGDDMSVLAPFLASSGAPNCSAGHQSNSCVPSKLRQESLQCLYDSQVVPIKDPAYTEWDPSLPCRTVDGYNISVGQPKNAISSFAFDALSCRNDRTHYLRQAGSMMGFMSYAFHAKGAASWTHHLDLTGLQCLAVNMLARANNLSHTNQFIPDIRRANSTGHEWVNYTFDINALVRGPSNCLEVVSSLLRTCNRTVEPGGHHSALYNGIKHEHERLPYYEHIFLRILFGANRYCYGSTVTEEFAKLIELLLAAGSKKQVPVDRAMLNGYTFTSPRPLRVPHDYLPPNGFCYNVDRFVVKFSEAMSVQGGIFPSILPQHHDLWHRWTAEALEYAADAFDTW